MKRLSGKFLSVVVAALMIFGILSPGVANAMLLPTTGTTLPPIKPAILKNIKYIYQTNVLKTDLSKFMENNGALIPPTGVAVHAGNVLVDEAAKASYFVRGINPDGSLIVRQPTMQEVFENFEIPKQTIKYNDANLIDLQPGIRNARLGIANPKELGQISVTRLSEKSGSAPGMQKLMSQSNSPEKDEVDKAVAGGWGYSFANSKLDAYLGNGQKISVVLSGKVQTNMSFTVDYSMFDGYEFGLTGGEVIGMKARLDASVNQEVYIPIVGIDINFNIGGVRAGLFLVVGVNGNITLVVAAEEGTSFYAGMRGKTCFGVPTSFKPFKETHAYSTAECDPNGTITAYAYLTPSISVKVLSINVFEVELRAGFLAYAQAEAQLLRYGVDAVIDFYVEVLGKGRHIFNKNFNLFSRKKDMPPGGFYFYGNLCAYRDDGIIAVYKARTMNDAVPDYITDPFADKLPYVGNVELHYYKANQTTNAFKVITKNMSLEDKGVFSYNFLTEAGINVAKGDSYRIVIPGNAQAFSKNVFSTIPFLGIKLDIADYFNENSYGQVLPATTHRDLPGWAMSDIKSDSNNQLLFCKDRIAAIKFIDPANKEPMTTANAVTDSEGKFRIDNFDIKPFRKAVPYINIDGFEIEGTPIDTKAGIFCLMATDYTMNLTAQLLQNVGTAQETKITVNSSDELDGPDPITNETYTTRDHILAINYNGDKKITNTLDYNTNAYFIKDVETIYKNAYVASQNGATVDLRKMLMESKNKTLFYNDHTTIPINEANNVQINQFEGNLSTAAAKALQEGQPLSTSHAYHRLAVLDEKYFPTVTRSTGIIQPGITSPLPLRRLVSGVKISANKANFSDITDSSQPKGVDATLTLNMQGSSLTHGYALDSIYVDTVAAMDIEGARIIAEQADPWIYKGRKQPITGMTPEAILEQEIQRFLTEGPLYFKRFVVHPIDFANTKANTWRPALNSVNHELIIDYNRGDMSIDGIRFKNVAKGAMVKGKLFLPARTITHMMGGISSFNARTGKLQLNSAGKSISINAIAAAGSRSAALAGISGRSISLKGETLGSGEKLQFSTTALTKLFGASIKLDSRKNTATVAFKGN